MHYANVKSKMNQGLDKGKSKQSTSSSIRDTITQVDQRGDELEGKIKGLNNDLRKFREQMSKMREGSDKNAVRAKVVRVLKQKRIYEQQLDNYRGQSFNMEHSLFAQEIVEGNRATLHAIKDASRQLKKEYQNIDVVAIQNVQDDLAKMMTDIDDIQTTLGQSYCIANLDEDEINAELDALGQEIVDDYDTSYLDDVMKAPEASTHKIVPEKATPSSKSIDKTLLN